MRLAALGSVVFVALAIGAAPASARYVFGGKWGEFGHGTGQFAHPRDVAVGPARNVYVADTANDRIQKFTAGGAFITKWRRPHGSADGWPLAIATDAKGRVYVAAPGEDRVEKFTPKGTLITEWGRKQWSGLADIATDAAGHVYVADTWRHRVQKFTANGRFLAAWGREGRGSDERWSPRGLDVGPAGNVYVVNYTTVRKFNAKGRLLRKWVVGRGLRGSKPQRATNVATDAKGNVYVGYFDDDRIRKFTAKGRFLTKWVSRGSQLGGIAAVGKGKRVYVTAAHRVQWFVRKTRGR